MKIFTFDFRGVFAIQLSALKKRISLYFSLPGSQASGISHPHTRKAGGVFLVLRFGHQFKSAVFCSASKKRRRHSQAVFTEASGLLAIYFEDKQELRGAAPNFLWRLRTQDRELASSGWLFMARARDKGE